MPREFFSENTPQQLAANSGQIFEAQNNAREQVAQQFDTVEDPSRVGIERTEDGFAPRESFLDRQLPREAAAELDPQFPGQTLGPGDVRETQDGQFRAREDVRRQRAASEFEQETQLQDVNPRTDLQRRQGGGFGLVPGQEQALAAERLDPEFPGQDLGPGDVARDPDGEGFVPTEGTRRRAAERQLEQDVPIDLDPFGDLTAREGGGFGLDQQAQQEVAAAELDPQFPGVDIGTGDVTRQDSGFGLSPQGEREVAAQRLSEQLGRDVAPSTLERQDDQFILPR